MEPNTQQVAKLKKTQLEILKTFTEICEKEKFTYWLLGGTALGAVRHNGFIPWDDDIDVGMPREDYERFMEKGQDFLPEYYFLQNSETEPDYPINFAKIRDSRTTFIESSVAHINMNHGVWIDVFPMDGFPETGIGRKIIKFKKALTYCRISKAFKSKAVAGKSLKGYVADVLSVIMYPTVKAAVKAREKMNRKFPYSTSRLVINNSGAYGDREVMERTTMGEGTEGKFEHLTVKLPAEYDKYLSTMYGDYMTPPPPEKQVGHHFADMVDCDNPYTRYAHLIGNRK